MSELTPDVVRAALDRATAGAPEPLPWAEIESRSTAGACDDPGDHRDGRRRVIWLAVAAATLLIAALTLAARRFDDSTIRIDDSPASTLPTGSTLPQSPSTTAPTTTAAPETALVPQTTPAPREGTVGSVDEASLRPLVSLSDRDIVIPTAPSDWVFFGDIMWDNQSSELLLGVQTLSPDDGPDLLGLVVSAHTACEATSERCDALQFADMDWPVLPVIEINGISWGYYNERRNEAVAIVGERMVLVSAGADLLDNQVVLEYLGGLRVGSLGDLPPEVTVLGATGLPIDPDNP